MAFCQFLGGTWASKVLIIWTEIYIFCCKEKCFFDQQCLCRWKFYLSFCFSDSACIFIYWDLRELKCWGKRLCFTRFTARKKIPNASSNRFSSEARTHCEWECDSEVAFSAVAFKLWRRERNSGALRRKCNQALVCVRSCCWWNNGLRGWNILKSHLSFILKHSRPIGRECKPPYAAEPAIWLSHRWLRKYCPRIRLDKERLLPT